MDIHDIKRCGLTEVDLEPFLTVRLGLPAADRHIAVDCLGGRIERIYAARRRLHLIRRVLIDTHRQLRLDTCACNGHTHRGAASLIEAERTLRILRDVRICGTVSKLGGRIHWGRLDHRRRIIVNDAIQRAVHKTHSLRSHVFRKIIHGNAAERRIAADRGFHIVYAIGELALKADGLIVRRICRALGFGAAQRRPCLSICGIGKFHAAARFDKGLCVQIAQICPAPDQFCRLTVLRKGNVFITAKFCCVAVCLIDHVRCQPGLLIIGDRVDHGLFAAAFSHRRVKAGELRRPVLSRMALDLDLQIVGAGIDDAGLCGQLRAEPAVGRVGERRGIIRLRSPGLAICGGIKLDRSVALNAADIIAVGLQLEGEQLRQVIDKLFLRLGQTLDSGRILLEFLCVADVKAPSVRTGIHFTEIFVFIVESRHIGDRYCFTSTGRSLCAAILGIGRDLIRCAGRQAIDGKLCLCRRQGLDHRAVHSQRHFVLFRTGHRRKRHDKRVIVHDSRLDFRLAEHRCPIEGKLDGIGFACAVLGIDSKLQVRLRRNHLDTFIRRNDIVAGAIDHDVQFRALSCRIRDIKFQRLVVFSYHYGCRSICAKIVLHAIGVDRASLPEIHTEYAHALFVDSMCLLVLLQDLNIAALGILLRLSCCGCGKQHIGITAVRRIRAMAEPGRKPIRTLHRRIGIVFAEICPFPRACAADSLDVCSVREIETDAAAGDVAVHVQCADTLVGNGLAVHCHLLCRTIYRIGTIAALQHVVFKCCLDLALTADAAAKCHDLVVKEEVGLFSLQAVCLYGQIHTGYAVFAIGHTTGEAIQVEPPACLALAIDRGRTGKTVPVDRRLCDSLRTLQIVRIEIQHAVAGIPALGIAVADLTVGNGLRGHGEDGGILLAELHSAGAGYHLDHLPLQILRPNAAVLQNVLDLYHRVKREFVPRCICAMVHLIHHELAAEPGLDITLKIRSGFCRRRFSQHQHRVGNDQGAARLCCVITRDLTAAEGIHRQAVGHDGHIVFINPTVN